MGRENIIRTPLYEEHIKLGAKMVDFHGFELPISYSSIQDEHLSTRTSCGIFDVSHMGFFRFIGIDVKAWLNQITTQDIYNFKVGTCGYTHFLDENGFIIDDMIFAIKSENEILGVPNASMIGPMKSWLKSQISSDNQIKIVDESSHTSIIAIQGPKSPDVISKILGKNNAVNRFRCQELSSNDLGISGWIQGTGYTGERGFEIFLNSNDACKLWRTVIELSEIVTKPVGLGARDTLRLEKGYLLSGQDFIWPGLKNNQSEKLPTNFLHRNTIETSVPFGLNLNHDFIGKEETVKFLKSSSRLIGIICEEKGPSPRPGHAVFDGKSLDGNLIGYVTSGAPSPSLNNSGIAMAYIEKSENLKEVWIQSSKKRRIQCRITKTPFL